jgi:hypothetical protein
MDVLDNGGGPLDSQGLEDPWLGLSVIPKLTGLKRRTKCAGLSACPPVLRAGPCGDRTWQPDFATPTDTNLLVTEDLLCIFLVTQSTTRLMSRRATVNDDIKGVRT